MIAIGSSSFIVYLDGSAGPDVDATELALAPQQAALPPAVLTELLSDPDFAPFAEIGGLKLFSVRRR